MEKPHLCTSVNFNCIKLKFMLKQYFLLIFKEKVYLLLICKDLSLFVYLPPRCFRTSAFSSSRLSLHYFAFSSLPHQNLHCRSPSHILLLHHTPPPPVLWSCSGLHWWALSQSNRCQRVDLRTLLLRRICLSNERDEKRVYL